MEATKGRETETTNERGIAKPQRRERNGHYKREKRER